MRYCPFYLFMLFSDPYMAGLALQYSLHHAILLCKVFPVPPFYQFLLYAVILHSCSYVAHIKVAEAQCCRECPLSFLLWTTMFSGVRQPVHQRWTKWDLLPLTYTSTFTRGGGGGHGVQGVWGPQLAMNRFLPLLATQISTLWIHTFGGGGGGGALILDQCRAFDLFASVDAHLCVHCAHPVHFLVLLSIVGIVYLLSS